MSSSSSVPIASTGGDAVAPTPQNTPLTQASLTTHMSRPTVPTVAEEDADDVSDEGKDGPPDSPPAFKAGKLGLGPDGQAAMLGMVHERLNDLMGQSSGYIESLPVGSKRKVEALKGIQTKWDDLQLKFKKECIELEKKYLKLATPLYDRRLDIITNKAQPTKEELEAGYAQTKKDDPEVEDLPDAPADPSTEEGANVGLEDFWLTALSNHPGISELISERDPEALKFLHDIRYEHLPEPDLGFKLIFTFNPNPFFENSTLEKTYYYQNELGYGGDFVFDRAKGTPIKWKEDKDLTKEIEIKKQRNKNTNRVRLVRKAVPVDSFFNFFDPPQPPTEEQLSNNKLDEEELEELDSKLEFDYQIGEDFKEKIIPRAVDYFTGKALQYEFSDDEDMDEYDEGDEDDSEEGSDSDDSGGKPAPPKKGGKKAAAGGGEGDCKNQ